MSIFGLYVEEAVLWHGMAWHGWRWCVQGVSELLHSLRVEIFVLRAVRMKCWENS